MACLGLTPALAATPEPPTLRLPAGVAPLLYDAKLTIDPNADDFGGAISIRIRLAQPTEIVWLNARKLALVSARAALGGAEDEGVAAAILPGNDDFVGLRFAKPLPAGEATLRIEYRGAFERSGVTGLFKQKDGDLWYVLSQFEPLDARTAFPCFDEPAFKAAWRIELTIPEGMKAFSNMPVEWRRKASPGWEQIGFRVSPAISTYLVALAVGPFDVIDGGTAGRNRTPLSYIAPKGRGREAAYAAKATPKILEALEDYFDRPYPFAKLDSIAIPDSGSFFGAMENVGLITYDARLLLAKPAETTALFEQRYVATAAHEISHMWFGNLVTMAWWDDLWLNEAFATWIENKVTDELRPDWHWALRRADRRAWAIETDQLVAARRIRQPIFERGEIRSAFDEITYSKGAAILTMFEQWLQAPQFRDGVRRYLAKNAWGNATAEDFFAALAAADQAVLPSFRDFVDKPGVPLLDVALDCRAAPVLKLAQSRFLPVGSTGMPGEHWVFPACFEYGDAVRGYSKCALVSSATQDLPLSPGGCPRWVVANRASIGYFLPRLDASLYASLPEADRVLGPADLVPLLADVNTLARGGALPLPTALTLAARYASHPEPKVGARALAVARAIPPELYDGNAGAFADWVRATYGHRARALGWSLKPKESPDTARLRLDEVPFVAYRGADPALRAGALALVERWRKDRRIVGRDLRPALLQTAARVAGTAGTALFEAYLHIAATSVDTEERKDVFAALGAFPDLHLLERALAIVLDDRFMFRESGRILQTALGDPATRPTVLAWLATNFDAAAQRAPQEEVGQWPHWAEQACAAAERERMVEVFAPRAAHYDGGAQAYREALEMVDLCLAYRARQEVLLTAFLAPRAKLQGKR